MVALMMTAALLLASCATGPGSKDTAAPSASKDAPAAKTDAFKEPTGASAERTSPSSGGERAANFAITTLDGERFELSDKRGEVVALYFMAGWCASCISEAEAWSKLYPAYEDEGLQPLMVSVDPNDTRKTIEAFRRAGGIRPLPWAIDRTGEIPQLYGVRSLDSTIIIDREGRIAFRDSAPTRKETLKRELEEVL
jgi:peroxiredoxin